MIGGENSVGESMIESVSSGIERYLNHLQCNQCGKQFIEISLNSLVRLWLTVPLPTILVVSNNINKDVTFLSLDPSTVT
jgi:hypothetical protein